MSARSTGFAAAFAAGLMVFAGSADARNWVATGWVQVPVRTFASAAAPLAGTIPGGSNVDLTGRCTRDLDLSQISYMSAWQQRALVGTRWCEVAGPTRGWVFGGFIKPF